MERQLVNHRKKIPTYIVKALIADFIPKAKCIQLLSTITLLTRNEGGDMQILIDDMAALRTTQEIHTARRGL